MATNEQYQSGNSYLTVSPRVFYSLSVVDLAEAYRALIEEETGEELHPDSDPWLELSWEQRDRCIQAAEKACEYIDWLQILMGAVREALREKV